MDWADIERIRDLQIEYGRIAIAALLPQIYSWGMKAEPKCIVELGVSKEALANKVLTMIAKKFNSGFISCDLYDFSAVSSYDKWYFVQAHDIDFADIYLEFCASVGISPEIDLLFVDTDEVYYHSEQEIQGWYPFLNRRTTVMHRCTNLKKELIYPDGSKTNLGWDNERGVVRAIEEYFNWHISEDKVINGFSWIDKRKDFWDIHHYPWGAGLTVLRRGF